MTKVLSNMTDKMRKIGVYVSFSGVCFFISGDCFIYPLYIYFYFYDIKNKERIYIKKIEKMGIRGSVSQRLPRNKGRLLPAFTCE